VEPAKVRRGGEQVLQTSLKVRHPLVVVKKMVARKRRTGISITPSTLTDHIPVRLGAASVYG